MQLAWLILLNTVIALPVFAAAPPQPFTAIYVLKKGPIIFGETRRTLMIDSEGNNIFESVTRPRNVGKLLTSGQIVERSRWIFLKDRLVPLEYNYFNTGSKQSHDVHLYFDWESRTVTNTINGDPWKMPLVDGAQDRLLYQLQLMLDLQAGKTEISYPVADGGKLKTYLLDQKNAETIRTPLGTFDTVRMRLVHGKRQTTIWCAPSLKFLPVRIEQRSEDEGPINAVLESVTGIE
jgi:hypothetical protein